MSDAKMLATVGVALFTATMVATFYALTFADHKKGFRTRFLEAIFWIGATGAMVALNSASASAINLDRSSICCVRGRRMTSVSGMFVIITLVIELVFLRLAVKRFWR